MRVAQKVNSLLKGIGVVALICTQSDLFDLAGIREELDALPILEGEREGINASKFGLAIPTIDVVAGEHDLVGHCLELDNSDTLLDMCIDLERGVTCMRN